MGRDRYVRHASGLILAEARRHVTQGKFELALETLDFMRQAQPSDPTAPTILGDLYRAWGRIEDRKPAEEAYLQAIRLDKRCADAHRGLGLQYLKDGKDELARDHLMRYLQIEQSAADADLIRQYVSKLEDKR